MCWRWKKATTSSAHQQQVGKTLKLTVGINSDPDAASLDSSDVNDETVGVNGLFYEQKCEKIIQKL